MNLKNSWLLCIGALLLGYDTNGEQACQLPTSIDAVNKFQPLIVYDSSFVYPKVNSTILHLDTKITNAFWLYCDGNSQFLIDSKSLPKTVIQDVVTVKCDPSSARYDVTSVLKEDNGPTTIHDHFYAKSYAEMSCSKEQVAEVLETMTSCPKLKYTTCVEIGFPKFSFGVINFIAIDTKTLRPYLALTHIPPVIDNRQVSNASRDMRMGRVFKESEIANMDEIYKRDYQRTQFFNIFRDHDSVDAYIPEKAGDYLTFGKLFTESDFFYTPQQSSVFFYENTVPVWKSVATGNWELAGKFVRKLVAKGQQDVRVFSGNYGTLGLPDRQGDLKTIYLARGPKDEPLIFVPEFLFKYVPVNLTSTSDGQLADGIIVVTLNNPYLTKDKLSKEGYLTPSCKPKSICQEIPEFTNLTRGFTFCCSTKEFEPVAKELNFPYNYESWMGSI